LTYECCRHVNAGEEGTPMLNVVAEETARTELGASLDEICREGARRMLAVALEVEVDAYVEALVDELDEDGNRLVVRNGHARPRTITTGAGRIDIRAPRVDDQRTDSVTGEPMGFKSSLVPPWCRKSPKVTEVLPLMYLRGMSSGDFVAALEGFFGSAVGLSASVITRLTIQWQDEHRHFSTCGCRKRVGVRDEYRRSSLRGV
jgi:putative transposase